jgi:hypothetical protein
MKTMLLCVFLIMLYAPIHAQDSASCEVSLLPIVGKYTGECKNNKAHGMGKSVGMDTYEGEFKKGYPDGEGIYTWKNGNYYKGTLKKGLRQGKGEFHFLRPGAADSIVSGYWQKDAYKGQNLKPYIIANTTSDVGRVEVNNTGGKERSITVSVISRVGTSSLGSAANNIVKMTGVNVIAGRYLVKATNALTDKEITVFQQVEFPFRAVFSFGNAQVEIEIFDEGTWDVSIPVTWR